MSKQKLGQAIEYLVNKETDKASELLKSYIIESAAAIHQKLVENEESIEEMERDVEHDDMGDDLADEVAADKDEIKSEEMSEDEGEEGHDGEEHEEHGEEHGEEGMEHAAEEASEEHLDIEDLEDEMEELTAEVDAADAHADKVEAALDDMGAKFDKLAAEFEKIKNTEEVEHDMDFDDNGMIGDGEPGEHAADAHEEPAGEEHGEEHMEELPHEEEHMEGLEESIELHGVKADMKDKAPGAGDKSPVPVAKDRIARLGGEPVKQSGPTHKGFAQETKKVGEVTKHSNVVNKGSDALTKTGKTNMTDKAPHAGASPAMPKGKK